MVTVINLDAQHGDSGALSSGFPLNRMETHIVLSGWRRQEQRAGSSVSSLHSWWTSISMSPPASKVARVEKSVEDLTRH